MRKSHQDTGSFVPLSRRDRLIINLVDSDYEWRDTIIRVSGPWEDALAKDRERVPTMWNRGPLPRRSVDPLRDSRKGLEVVPA